MIIDKNRVYRKAEDELNRLEILLGNGESIIGLLQEPLSFSVDADWSPLFDLHSVIGGVSNLVNLAAQASLGNTGIASRRFYKGGSYLKIEPKIRIVDWNGDGIVINTAKILTDLALPSNSGKSFGEGIVKLANSFGVEAPKTAREIAETTGSIITKNPNPVTVKISNYFRWNFIIENVSCEFSKEMTKSGDREVPLYGDFSIVFSSREVMLKGDNFLTGNDNKLFLRKSSR